jgi:hypothetical protein
MHRIAMFDVFVCYMHVLDVFEVIYMDIYVFAILKCGELMKNKKNRKYWRFFAVRDRGWRTTKDAAKRMAKSAHGNAAALDNACTHGKGKWRTA